MSASSLCSPTFVQNVCSVHNGTWKVSFPHIDAASSENPNLQNLSGLLSSAFEKLFVQREIRMNCIFVGKPVVASEQHLYLFRKRLAILPHLLA